MYMGSVYACVYPCKGDFHIEPSVNKLGEIIMSEISEFILKEFNNGNIIFHGICGLQGGNLKEFIKQPTNGILYDLNRDEAIILSHLYLVH